MCAALSLQVHLTCLRFFVMLIGSHVLQPESVVDQYLTGPNQGLRPQS